MKPCNCRIIACMMEFPMAQIHGHIPTCLVTVNAYDTLLIYLSIYPHIQTLANSKKWTQSYMLDT